MSEGNIPSGAYAKVFFAIPFLRRAAIVNQKMIPPVQLLVTDSVGNIVYEEHFKLDDQGRIISTDMRGMSEQFLLPLTVRLFGEDKKVWEPELERKS